MAEIVKDFWAGMPIGMYIILILGFVLLCVSFVIPPLGVISPSVLQGVSIILGFTWLFYVTTHIKEILAAGGKVKANVGNIASVEIGRKKEENNENKTEE